MDATLTSPAATMQSRGVPPGPGDYEQAAYVSASRYSRRSCLGRSTGSYNVLWHFSSLLCAQRHSAIPRQPRRDEAAMTALMNSQTLAVHEVPLYRS